MNHDAPSEAHLRQEVEELQEKPEPSKGKIQRRNGGHFRKGCRTENEKNTQFAACILCAVSCCILDPLYLCALGGFLLVFCVVWILLVMSVYVVCSVHFIVCVRVVSLQ